MSDAGQRLAWFLDRMRDGASGLSDADVAAAWTCTPPAPPAGVRRAVCAHFAAAIGAFTIREYESARDDFAAAVIEDGRGRPWRIWVQLESPPDRRIRIAACVLAPPAGITLRRARPEDAPALRALERRSPIVMGDVRVTYDRGDDFFAGARLIGDAHPTVAERNGELVAMHCMITHDLRIGGVPISATYLHHSRIAPEAQGAGVFSALNGAELERHAADGGFFYSYVAAGNEAGQKIVPVKPWTLRPERFVIDCQAHAGPPRGRLATHDDAARIVALLNAAHAREELFVPYTEARLTTRLGREPNTYGWSHLLLDDRAVVGVWPAAMRVVRESPTGREETVRALVLDTGFASGAEDDLVAVIRATCGTLAALGCTHLTLFTSPGSPGYAALRPLATRIEPYLLNIGVPDPPDLAERGIYVDHLYF